MADIELEKNGYGFRYFFDAGIDRITGACDRSGVTVYEKDRKGNWHYAGEIANGMDTCDIEDLTDEELNDLLIEYGIF